MERRADAEWPHWPGRTSAPRRERLERRLFAAPATTDGPQPHVLLIHTPGGYTLADGEGTLPKPGDRILRGGIEYVAESIGRSPLPADRRRCVYLQPA